MANYCYTLHLKGGRKYVGSTSNLKKRLAQHFSGNGAMWTKKHKPIRVHSVTKCKSKASARAAETIVYHRMKNYHGTSKVRGAGHTKST